MFKDNIQYTPKHYGDLFIQGLFQFLVLALSLCNVGKLTPTDHSLQPPAAN